MCTVGSWTPELAQWVSRSGGVEMGWIAFESNMAGSFALQLGGFRRFVRPLSPKAGWQRVGESLAWRLVSALPKADAIAWLLVRTDCISSVVLLRTAVAWAILPEGIRSLALPMQCIPAQVR